MVIVGIIGGLGNQMFEYAFGYRTAKENNTQLAMDLHKYRRFNDRTFLLDQYRIEYVDTAPHVPAWIKLCETRVVNKLLRTLRIRRIRLFSYLYVLEKEYAFSDRYLADHVGCNVYLNGYWQSPRYFENYSEDIRKNFTVRAACPDSLQPVFAEMARNESVSLHIRRGDYLNPKNQILFSGKTYYQEAIRIIRARVQNPIFYVFTDDPDWVKQEGSAFLNVPFTVVQADDPHADIFEMLGISRCKHHINAFSSFSWWGAWLGTYPDGIVVLPGRKWNPTYAPTNWITIEEPE